MPSPMVTFCGLHFWPAVLFSTLRASTWPAASIFGSQLDSSSLPALWALQYPPVV